MQPAMYQAHRGPGLSLNRSSGLCPRSLERGSHLHRLPPHGSRRPPRACEAPAAWSGKSTEPNSPPARPPAAAHPGSAHAAPHTAGSAPAAPRGSGPPPVPAGGCTVRGKATANLDAASSLPSSGELPTSAGSPAPVTSHAPPSVAPGARRCQGNCTPRPEFGPHQASSRTRDRKSVV